MPLPEPDQDSTPYWDACREGRLLFQRCRQCGRAVFYPRARCPSCGADEMDWEEASGRGTVYSYSVLSRSAEPALGLSVPYVVALIDLAEGARIMSNIVDCPAPDVDIGMAVQVRFEPVSAEISLPVFAPETVKR